MKIIQLEYFLAIVKYNSFTKAAQFLHISQPSLTATIKKMEADLGYDLFTRSTKRHQDYRKRNTVLSLCERISSTISIHDGKNV